MSEVHCETIIDVQELYRSNDPTLRCIDVRSPSEFAAGHIPAAINISMDEIESRLDDLRVEDHVVLVCQSGKRASMTYGLLAHHGRDLTVLSGGTDAWRRAGLPLVASTRSRWSLERQVRLGAGLLVLTGVVLGLLLHRDWFYLAGFVGAGLVFAGTTNYCAMANLLALLPWNRRGSSKPCPNTLSCRYTTK